MLSGGSGGQGNVFEAFDGFETFDQGADTIWFSVDRDDFQAIVVIKVDVLGGDDRVMAVMLYLG